MLQIKEISKTFNPGTVNEKKALRSLSLTLADGDFVTVIGGNGAGKSTLLNAIAGTWFVDEGKILLDDKDVTGLPEYKRAKFLGRVFQDPMNGTAATMEIEENLALAFRQRRQAYLEDRNHPGRAEDVPGSPCKTGAWSGKPYDLQGRTAFGWTETGTDPSDGYLKETKGIAFG